MCDMSDKIQKYEENNWQELAERFIKKHEALWIDFVDEEFLKHVSDQKPDFDCDDSKQL